MRVVVAGGKLQGVEAVYLAHHAGWEVVLIDKNPLAPAGITREQDGDFRGIAAAIGRKINLTGIMDVEAIFHNKQFKVLEIDARLPSQTPTAVLKSTGINMLKMLADVYVKGISPDIPETAGEKGVVYEHIKVTRDIIEVSGEHIMSDKGPLYFKENFFGANEAITNYTPTSSQWVATMIFTEVTIEEAWEKRCVAVDHIMKNFSLISYRDPAPRL